MGPLGQFALLATLDGAVGIGVVAWAAGLGCALLITGLLVKGLRSRHLTVLGPANRVTLIRSILTGGVLALLVEGLAVAGRTGGFGRPALVPLIVVLSSVALVLDSVDGRVARRTGTVSPLGARFDMEVDALLILVLSVLLARTYGGWVLLIGAARYALLAATMLAPWLRAPAPPRHWCKVVAALQGIVLTVAVAGVLPRPWTVLLLAGALVLLAESFGREVWWLHLHRNLLPVPTALVPAGVSGPAEGRLSSAW